MPLIYLPGGNVWFISKGGALACDSPINILLKHGWISRNCHWIFFYSKGNRVGHPRVMQIHVWDLSFVMHTTSTFWFHSSALTFFYRFKISATTIMCACLAMSQGKGLGDSDIFSKNTLLLTLCSFLPPLQERNSATRDMQFTWPDDHSQVRRTVWQGVPSEPRAYNNNAVSVSTAFSAAAHQRNNLHLLVGKTCAWAECFIESPALNIDLKVTPPWEIYLRKYDILVMIAIPVRSCSCCCEWLGIYVEG